MHVLNFLQDLVSKLPVQFPEGDLQWSKAGNIQRLALVGRVGIQSHNLNVVLDCKLDCP